MPSFTIDAPNGKSYTVEGDNAQGALAALQQHLGDNARPSITDAVTDIPSEIANAASEGWQNIKGLASRGEKTGVVEGLMTLPKAVMGAGQVLMSPVTGTARSVGGHLMAAGERLVGENIVNPIVESLGGQAQHPDPQKMYEAAKGDVDLAMSGLGSRGAPVGPPNARLYVGKTPEVVQAGERLADTTGAPINVPNAIASDNIAVQRVGQGIRNIPIVGDAIPQATQGLVEDLGGAVKNVADQYGSGSGPNVAGRIGRTIGTSAEREAQAARAAADSSDAAVLADWERAHTSARDAIGAAETNAADTARRAVGDMSPQDMGQTLIARLRQGEREAHATKERLYGVAANTDGAIDANAVRGIRGDVTRSLDEQGLVVDPTLTPAASRMVTELDNISSLRIPNRVAPTANPDEVAAVNMQGLEQTRKRLNALRAAASNNADQRAARHIINAYDDWIGNAFDRALFSGSDEALQAYRAARAANTEWRQRFGFNERDDADRIINRIVTGEVTPQEVSNYIVGASKVGAKGVSSRLLTRLAEATGGDPEALQAIRGGVWNRLSQATEGTTAKPPAKIINDIHEFLGGSGRDVANRLFTPAQQGVMRAYADTLRRGGQARETLEEAAKNSKPSASPVRVGPMQELADAVLGKGGKTDEALFNAIDSYAKAGGRADVQTLADIVRNIPVKDRGDLAGSIIRNLGVSPRTGQFSPDVFASQWKSYTPQAKAILFGNAGPQRQAIDDIMTISERLKQVGQRFGNPSGTAQNVNLLALATGFIAAPLATLSAAVGGAVAAKILAAPATASSAAKWARTYAALTTRPSAQTIAAYQVASRNLANTAQLGSNASVIDFMKALQAPSMSAAQDQQQVPRPPGQ